MNDFLRSIILGCSLASGAVFLSSCEKGPSKAALEWEINDLKTELARLKKSSEVAVDANEALNSELKTRLEQTEQKSESALEQASTALTQQKARFERVETNISSVIRMVEQSESLAKITPDMKGHRTLQTEHGTFLVQIRGVERDLVKGRYMAQLTIGNPIGLMVQRFVLKGDFGQQPPQLKPAEPYSEYSARLDAWQKTLTPFEEEIAADLVPNSWTEVELPLNATTLDDLKMMRFSMVVTQAHLVPSDQEQKYSVINAAGTGASLVKTDYGPFLVNVQRMETEGNATRLYLMIGNPFGFIVNEARVKGQFGPAPPRRMETESPQLFSGRMQTWMEQMAPFESQITEPIAPFQWSNATLLIPTTDRSLIQYIRCNMDVVNITLQRRTEP